MNNLLKKWDLWYWAIVAIYYIGKIVIMSSQPHTPGSPWSPLSLGDKIIFSGGLLMISVLVPAALAYVVIKVIEFLFKKQKKKL